MIKKANAIWHGNGREGYGMMSTDSDLLNDVKYTSKSRFEGAPGGSPEELIAAALSACFSMQLSFNLSEHDFPPVKLEVQCAIKMENFVINESRLVVKAEVPGIDKDTFNGLVEDARLNCPISKLLDVSILVEASLS